MRLVKDKKFLEIEVNKLQLDLATKCERFRVLENQLNDQMWKIKMFTRGTKDLDKSLTMENV